MFQSLENKRQSEELQKTTRSSDKFVSSDSKQHKNMHGSILEKNSTYLDKRFVNTDHLRLEYGDNHIWDVPIQRQPIIQMYVRQPRTYDDDEIVWEKGEAEEFWKTVDAGLTLAGNLLRKGMMQMQPVGNYAKKVLSVLTAEDLKIYPMISKTRVGQSAFGERAISLGVNSLNGNVHELAKTLIHEAFHIAGGCWKKDESGRHVYDSKLDVACRSRNSDWIYQTYLQNNEMIYTRADAFAQYIMLLK